jgi:integrase/recombinase XerD
MSPMAKAVEEYLALRRALGFELRGSAGMLRSFAHYLEQQRASHVSTELALRWAKQPTAAQPVWWAHRLGVVRRFAQYLSASDPRTEIPPIGLLPFRYRRKPPYLYSDAEVRALVSAASRIASPTGLRAATYSTLIGLLAVSGLRISEAIGLDDRDVDLAGGVLTIRRTKFGKSRLVPLHRSTTRALHRYVRLRNRIHRVKACDSFFVGERGQRLTQWTVRWTFNKLSRSTGLRKATDQRGPRLHDFRHRLAVNTLLRWYRRGVDVERQLPVLSTYLGHGHVTDTYWYLTAVPELLRLAAERLEAHGGRQS